MRAPSVSIAVQDNHGYARVLTPASNLRSQVSMARKLRASLAMVGSHGLANAPITRSPVRGYSDRGALADQLGHHQAPETAGATGDEDHELPAICARTASLTSPRLVSTASR